MGRRSARVTHAFGLGDDRRQSLARCHRSTGGHRGRRRPGWSVRRKRLGIVWRPPLPSFGQPRARPRPGARLCNAMAERRSSAPARRPSGSVTCLLTNPRRCERQPAPHDGLRGPPFVREQVCALVPARPRWWRIRGLLHRAQRGPCFGVRVGGPLTAFARVRMSRSSYSERPFCRSSTVDRATKSEIGRVCS